ncbi:uncharacterized protein ACO6RY_03214 [Pungitius sinensis]
MKEMRIVMLGKTGCGKSSVANTILGENVFKVGHTVNSETSECQSETRRVDGRDVTFIDTPGLFDTHRPEEELKAEIVSCITEFAPGPHAFIIVFNLGRFTEQEQEVIDKINQYFSEEAFKYATLLFTHGDDLDEGQTIEDFLQNNQPMRDLMKKCGGRCHVVDNKYWKNNQQDEYRSNQFQVKQLLKTIDHMMEANKGSFYTNEMLQVAEKLRQEEEEKIRKSPGNMTEEEIREEAKKRTSGRLLIHLAGVTTGMLLGALFGVVTMGSIGLLVVKKGLTIAKHSIKLVGLAAGGAAGAGGGGAGAVGGAAGAVGVGAGAVEGAAGAVGGAAGAVGVGAGAVEGAAGAVGGAAGAAGGILAFTVACGVVGAVGGGIGGYCEAKEAKTPQEAAVRTAEAVMAGSRAVVDGVKNVFKQ